MMTLRPSTSARGPVSLPTVRKNGSNPRSSAMRYSSRRASRHLSNRSTGGPAYRCHQVQLGSPPLPVPWPRGCGSVLAGRRPALCHRVGAPAPRCGRGAARAVAQGRAARALGPQPLVGRGVAADGGGYVAQFLALGHGPLVIVQPLLVSGLLFALPLGAFLAKRRITTREVWAAAAVVVGLAALLIAAYPEAGHADATGRAWVVLLLATLVPAALLVGGALRVPSLKPALLATSAGVIYGLTAALTKVTAHQLGNGVGHALTGWQLYVLVAVGVVGMVLTQSAFQAGPLRASLPPLTVIEI